MSNFRKMRFCKRCEKIFITSSKFGRICEDCKINVGRTNKKNK